MPIYEYHCRDCGRRVSIFFRSLSTASDPVCPRCGSKRLDKLMSRVTLRRGRSAEDIDLGHGDGDLSLDDSMEDMGSEFGDGIFDDDADPRELARWTRQMSRQMGEPIDDDLDRALGDIEHGADPDEALDRLEDTSLPEPEA